MQEADPDAPECRPVVGRRRGNRVESSNAGTAGREVAMELTYPFRSDAEWNEWSLTVVPDIVSAGVELELPEALVLALQAKHNVFKNAYGAAVAPDTRSGPKIEAKRDALRAFKSAVRPVIDIIQANPAVTNERRRELGLRVRRGTGTPSPVPATAPSVMTMLTGPQSIRVTVRDPAASDRRAKPAGVRQVGVYVRRGATPGGPVADWPLDTLSGRTTVDLIWEDIALETTVWVSCCWLNSRSERGPFSPPRCVRLPGGAMQFEVQAAATPAESTGPAMKIAA